MAQYEIYWSDLTEDAQERLSGMYHDNIEMSPIAIVDIEDDDDIEDENMNVDDEKAFKRSMNCF